MCNPYPTFVKASPDIPDIALTTNDVKKLNLPTPSLHIVPQTQGQAYLTFCLKLEGKSNT